ncbi:helicase [Desulfuribacillus stibiiarsenatis]|uniref:Helicase n=1 Tax=Desulfuribacillus stibiiarsenatis TaxID=1390249 RepID=A0A1E5L8D4_9FIRM|nr:ATP-dependent DNA helicase [Desulfuribacillus stibiiarsenatis]OEH86386.1 helicase [Desulfuribacillus stibiiarsenatis]
MTTKLKVPFDYKSKEEFPIALANWIGDVFYDILPEHGYEVREEQVFTAFQLAEAVCHNKVHLAEAGLGTGKTFAYLLTAIAYARFSGKPVIIACATSALQEQLAGPKGDIQTLSNLLGLAVDARMARESRQYICDERVQEARSLIDDTTQANDIYQWLDKTITGERSEIPHISDRLWKQIGWDESVDCDMCSSIGYCKLAKAREQYRPARDLIIADRGIFFEDLWTRDERIADGKRPMLPNYSAVIFDEGHKVILPAAMQAGQKINKEDMDSMIFSLDQVQEARDSLVLTVDSLERECSHFFKTLNRCVVEDDRSERLAIRVDDTLLAAAEAFHKVLDQLLLELQIELELYTESLTIRMLHTYEFQIEMAMIALERFSGNESKDVITWVDQIDGSFWVVPRNLSEMLDKHLFQKKLPVVFTSATLSNEGDFSYFARTLGLKEPSSSTVGSSFDMEKQVVVYLSNDMGNSKAEATFAQSIEQLVSMLKSNGGRALVLTNSLTEVRNIRKGFKDYQLPFEVLWEDKGERGHLVRKFRENVSSVLIGSTFWEGIDVPGESLSLLVVWELPFPSLDPLIEVQRKEAIEDGLDPIETVDYPEMGLKLKQGCGRLIRSKDDRGAIVIMDNVIGYPWEKVVMGALPPGSNVKVKAFNKTEIL